MKVLRGAASVKKSYSKKVILLKKKQVEVLFKQRPWNQDLLMAVLDKYAVKLKVKSENFQKIQTAIATFFENQGYSDIFIRADIWKHISEILTLIGVSDLTSVFTAAQTSHPNLHFNLPKVLTQTFEQGTLSQIKLCLTNIKQERNLSECEHLLQSLEACSHFMASFKVTPKQGFTAEKLLAVVRQLSLKVELILEA